MQLVLAATLFAALAGSQPAGRDQSWVLVNRSTQHTSYLDVRSIRIQGTVRSAWTRSDYDVPTESGAYRTYFRQDLDCAERTFSLTEYVNQDRDGRELSRGAIPAEQRRTHRAQPDTQAETLVNMVCN